MNADEMEVVSIFERSVLNEDEPYIRKVGDVIRVRSFSRRVHIGQDAHIFMWGLNNRQVWLHTANAIVTALHDGWYEAKVTEFVTERTWNVVPLQQAVRQNARAVYNRMRQGRGGPAR